MLLQNKVKRSFVDEMDTYLAFVTSLEMQMLKKI